MIAKLLIPPRLVASGVCPPEIGFAVAGMGAVAALVISVTRRWNHHCAGRALLALAANATAVVLP